MPWTIDPKHSHLDFAVKHLGISTVRGRFLKFRADIEESNQMLRSVTVTVDASSIDTGEPQRDQHLRSGDFLDVEHYPEIRFVGTGVTARGQGQYRVEGELTMRGQTHPVSFDVELSEAMKDPWGNHRAAATGRGKLNRRDWGLTWNQALELGGWAVGDEVRFSFDLEAVMPAPDRDTVVSRPSGA
jgi:polyisoprenoid-binding protein YceI